MKTKKNLSIAESIAIENKVTKSESLESKLYETLAGVELTATTQSLRLSVLVGKTANELKSYVSRVVKANEETETENFCTLKKVASDFLKSYQTGEEKRNFLHKLWKVRKATKNFSITYQSEQNEETKGNSESGLTPYRFTTISAAGLRTCFNSYDIFRTEKTRIARKQAKQAKEEKVNNLALSFGLTAEQIRQLLDAAK